MGRLVYSQDRLPLRDAGEHEIQLSNNKRSKSFRTQSAEAARSFVSCRTCLRFREREYPLPLDQIWRREQSENLCSADLVPPVRFTPRRLTPNDGAFGLASPKDAYGRHVATRVICLRFCPLSIIELLSPQRE